MANTNTDKDLLHPREALKILDSLTEANQFCSYGACPLELPGLEIAPVGEVSLPITATSAKQLIKVANQAPYGRGEETIVDTEVRNVWQLEPHQVDAHHCDIDHVTDRRGSPQTLVCTKNRATYKSKCKEFEGNVTLLDELRAIN